MNSQNRPATNWSRQRFAVLSRSFEGAEAIYVERPLILHVSVTQVSSDDWGVRAKLTDLRSPGMHRIRSNSFDISSAWDVFSFTDHDWDTPNIPQCRFRLFFHPVVVRPSIELATMANRNGARIGWDDFLSIARRYYDMREEESEDARNKS